MRPIFITATAAGFVVLPILAAPALAQANRTFVSGFGSDSNPCSLGAPCRSFAGALAQTNAGGEITVLDSAGYGSVTIAKSVTITNPGGVEAGVSVANGLDAVQINAGSSSVNVTLRGLTLQGVSGSANGINWVSGGGTLNVIDCVTKDFGTTGILISPATGSPNLKVTISGTTVLNNGTGINITATSGGGIVKYSISHTITNENALDGILISTNTGATSNGTISSVHSELNSKGLENTGTGNNMNLMVSNSTFVSNSSADFINTFNGNGGNQTLNDANRIGLITLGGISVTVTDGTNYFSSVNFSGGTLTMHAPQ